MNSRLTLRPAPLHGARLPGIAAGRATSILVALAVVVLIASLGVSLMSTRFRFSQPGPAAAVAAELPLPPPAQDSATSVERALGQRRSIRAYRDQPLEQAELGQLLWAAQGITDPLDGLRTAPSAGALYPLEIYVAVGQVAGLEAGTYRYDPAGHRLLRLVGNDVRAELARAALGQGAVADAPAAIVIAAVYERTTGKYGQRGARYVHLEAGHAAQNVYLQAVSLGLGTVAIGAFDDDRVARIVGLQPTERPLYLLPVGRP